jgi:hypothetical protein
MLIWGYDARNSIDGQNLPFAKSGYELFVCPGVSDWNRILPDFGVAVTNIHNFVCDGIKHGAIGTLNTDLSCSLLTQSQRRGFACTSANGSGRAGPITSGKAPTCCLTQFPSAPDRNYLPPAADPAHNARLVASGMLREGRRKKEEGRMWNVEAAVILKVQSSRDGRVVKSLERRVPDGR